MQKFIHFYRTQYYSNWRIIIANALCFNALALTSVCSCLYVWLCVCVDAALTLIWFSAWGPRQAVVTFLTVHCWISPLRQLCACICVTECVCVYVFRCIACRLCVNHLIFTHPSRHVPNFSWTPLAAEIYQPLANIRFRTWNHNGFALLLSQRTGQLKLSLLQWHLHLAYAHISR